MSTTFSKIIAWVCYLLLFVFPSIAFYYLVDIQAFIEYTKNNVSLPILWETVNKEQFYLIWFISFDKLLLTLFSLYFLHKAFKNFAKGELFTLDNSINLRRFAIILFAQSISTPLFYTLRLLVLSYNHPKGQQILSFSFGGDEIKVILLAMIIWVISDLLIKANRLETENKQFI